MDKTFLRQWALRGVYAESMKFLLRKLDGNFLDLYMQGAVIDIGCGATRILPEATAIDKGYPGYDERTLPFADESFDTVFSSHCLEHIDDYQFTLREWYRVCRTGGFIVMLLPHKFLYEKREAKPSRWNTDHRRFYTPASLLGELEQSLEPNSYRVRHLADGDDFFDYNKGPEVHSEVTGRYDIELVVQKITKPSWRLAS